MMVVEKKHVGYFEQAYEPPREITISNVKYWEEESKRLMKLKKDGYKSSTPYLSKAKKFLENDCVKRSGDNSWKILPIKNYNKTTHFVQNGLSGFYCSCQGFKNNDFCSHILAVKQFEFMQDYNSKQEFFGG